MKFEDLLGNEVVLDLLRSGRLPQASVFCGPEGIGKKTSALLLAALANCKAPSGNDLCGRCASCFKAQGGNHPDIRLYQPEGASDSIKIEAMREMSREAQYRPFEGKLRFFIIDEAEKMNEAAANSILKTLEEPPETSRLILISSAPQRLLATIRSRCQLFRFQPLTRKQIVDALNRQGHQEEAGRRASFAEGSLGQALSLDLGQAAADRDHVLGLLASWRKHSSFLRLFEACEKEPMRSDLKKRDRVKQFLHQLQILAQDLYFLQVGSDGRVANQDRLADLQELAQGIELDWISRFLYHVAEAQRDLGRYVSPLMCFETLWLQCRSGSERGFHAADRYRQV